jgi:hypothetical protein
MSKTNEDRTFYSKTNWGYTINRTTYNDGKVASTKQYGVAAGPNMAQFLGINPDAETVDFKETFEAPLPRHPDTFPSHVNAYKFGFGKKG